MDWKAYTFYYIFLHRVMSRSPAIDTLDLYQLVVQECGEPPFDNCFMMKKAKDVVSYFPLLLLLLLNCFPYLGWDGQVTIPSWFSLLHCSKTVRSWLMNLWWQRSNQGAKLYMSYTIIEQLIIHSKRIGNWCCSCFVLFPDISYVITYLEAKNFIQHEYPI